MADQNGKDVRQGAPTDQEEIYGGEISRLDEGLPKFDEARHRAETASRLAFWLVGVLVASVVLHYAAVTILGCIGQGETAKVLDTIFDKWLPVISGFVGGAITYYFTRDKR